MRFTALTLFLVASLSLGACGYKDDLYLPAEKDPAAKQIEPKMGE